MRAAILLLLVVCASAQFAVFLGGNNYYQQLFVAPLYPKTGTSISFYTGGLGESLTWKMCATTSTPSTDYPIVLVANSTGVFAVEGRYQGRVTYLTTALNTQDPNSFDTIQC
jgi:hypothetical protein